jgi:peptidase M23-like protein
MASHRTTARAVLLLLLIGVFTQTANAAEVPDVTAFPVVGNVHYIDDWHDARPGGWHEGNDIMSIRHQPAVAFEKGWIEKWSHASGAVPSCMLVLHGRSGMVYWYIHLNNDKGPGNDNDAGCRKAYAPGLRYHDRVNRGELVGFVGDSGDANGIQPHLHFEVHKPSGRPIDPFQYLNKAPHLLFPKPRADLGDVTVTLKGSTVVSKSDSTITVKTKRVVVAPLGLDFANRRRVTLSVPAEAVVARKSGGSLTSADLSAAREGDRARITTLTFTPTWKTQRALAGSISVAKILLIG